MTRWIAGALTLALALTTPTLVTAQSKSLMREQRTATATITAIDQTARRLTLKKSDGNHVDVQVPEDIKRFSMLKVGDVITATYYENVVVLLKRPGEPAVDTATRAGTPAASGRAGTIAKQRTITATITAIDLTAPSVTFTGPNGWQYTSPVEDVAALKRVKVGEQVDIVWTDALLLSVASPASK
jgi:hypothetical protein